MMKPRGRTLMLVALAGSAACGGGDDDGPVSGETAAPLCTDIAGGTPRELFTHEVVPAADVLETLIFGGMDPGTLEPINFELGYRLTDIDVPVVAPADLYVRSFEYTEYQVGSRAGETDYALTFHVCSTDEGEGARVAVEGDFAHMTALEPVLADIVDTAQFDCSTNAGPEETVETCRTFFPSDDDGLVIEAGTAIASAGGTGLTDYAPGFDFNLLDTRYENPFINRDRIGAEDGPGRWFRYGACVYDYFVEPHRSAYLGVVGQNGDLRDDPDAPCGTLDIDEGGTAAGVWIRADNADLDIASDWIGVLESLLVLAPHHVFPGSREVVSTEITDLASWDGGGLLVEFEPIDAGDVNRSFYDMEPGTIHCLSTIGFGNPVPHDYYVEVGAGGDTLTIERLDTSCADVAQADRAFGGAAIDFVR